MRISSLSKLLPPDFSLRREGPELLEVLSLQLAGSGAVAELEHKIANHFAMKHALATSSATSGLLAIALAIGLHDSEFITTPYTYGASIASWLMLGNKPIFADIDPLTLTIDPAAVRKAVTTKTRALLAVDIFGHPSDTENLRAVADELGIWYIADGAQSLGAYRDGLPASHLADAVVMSFTAGKPLCAGEGGAIATRNVELYGKAIWYTQHPDRQRKTLGLHLSNEFAVNARIHPLAAIWANARLEDSLYEIKNHRGLCFRIIDLLNSVGLTQVVDYEVRGIEPSFFRLTAAWKGRSAFSEIEQAFADSDMLLGTGPSPIELLYRQPAFLAQCGRRYRIPSPCRVAERQARDRFTVTFEPNSVYRHTKKGRVETERKESSCH
jgi:perosamine synthetase